MAFNRDFDTKYERDAFVRELMLVRNSASLELPANVVKGFTHSGNLHTLECVGFTLTNRFPNNIAIVQDDYHEFKRGVMWVTSIEVPSPEDYSGVKIHGHVFADIDDISCHPVASHTYGTFLAGNPHPQAMAYPMEKIIGKGMALHTDALSGPISPVTPLPRARKWVVDVIDHHSL